MMREDQHLWQLEIAYTVQCVRCFQREEVIKPMPGQAIDALAFVGWTANAAGPWCPECKTLLYARRGRKHSLCVGDQVCQDTSRTLLGHIVQLGDGYAEVRRSDGIQVYCTAELVKVK